MVPGVDPKVDYALQEEMEGQAEGLEQGEVIGQIHVYQRMMKLPLTPREELLAIPLAKLRETAKAVEDQLRIPRA